MNALAFLAGVLSLYQLSVIPPVWVGVLIIPVTVVFFTVPRTAFATSFFIGFLTALCQSHWSLSQMLPADLAGRDLRVEGTVIDVPETRSKGHRFLFSIDGIGKSDNENQPIVQWIARINWYHDQEPPKAGERWQLLVRLREPQGFLNPYGFDYETWLFQKGIRATGYVRSISESYRLAPANALGLDRIRETSQERLQEFGANEGGSGAIVSALALGIKGGLSQEQWEVFRKTGTSHLMAISGLHIGLVAGLGFFLGFYLWSRCAACSLRFSAVKAGALAALCLAAFYAAMAGFSVPTQRALIMLGVVMFALLLGRSMGPLRGLGVALVLVLLLDTSAVLSIGFWLSFAAVAAIFLSMDKWRQYSVVVQFLAMQLLLSLLFIPLAGWFFGEASLVSPIANSQCRGRAGNDLIGRASVFVGGCFLVDMGSTLPVIV